MIGTFREKFEYTEKVYYAMLDQFPELAGGDGNPDLKWEEMWKYFDDLNDSSLRDEQRMSRDHLWNCLKSPGNKFVQLPEGFWDKFCTVDRKT